MRHAVGYPPGMSSRRVLGLLLLASLVRLASQAWDAGGLFPHPDERQVAFVAERAAGWFTDPGFYAYGSLHFQVVRAMAFVLGLPRAYDGLIVAGRALSLLLSVGALVLAWWTARRAWGRRAGALVLAIPDHLVLFGATSIVSPEQVAVGGNVLDCCGAGGSNGLQPLVLDRADEFDQMQRSSASVR